MVSCLETQLLGGEESSKTEEEKEDMLSQLAIQKDIKKLTGNLNFILLLEEQQRSLLLMEKETT